MYPKGPSMVLFALMFVLLAALLVGCGGADQSGNGAQGGAPSDEKGQDGGVAGGSKEQAPAERRAPTAKIALGTIESVWPERRRVELQPTAEIQGGERMVFNVTKKAEVTLNGEEVQLTDARKGQQAQIEYVVLKVEGKNQQVQARIVNRARAVQLFKGEGGE
jgi:hypothetical protein